MLQMMLSGVPIHHAYTLPAPLDADVLARQLTQQLGKACTIKVNDEPDGGWNGVLSCEAMEEIVGVSCTGNRVHFREEDRFWTAHLQRAMAALGAAEYARCAPPRVALPFEQLAWRHRVLRTRPGSHIAGTLMKVLLGVFWPVYLLTEVAVVLGAVAAALLKKCLGRR